jgi:activator of HSP90 ATPase
MKNRSQVNSKPIASDDVCTVLGSSDPRAIDHGVATRHPSRRTMIAGALMGVGSLALAAERASGFPEVYRSIHQEVDLAASPSRVYGILLDEKLFSAFTGASAQIDSAPGGAFSLFQGHPPLLGVTGRNIEVVPNQRIVQAWRAGEWAAGVYSIVRFEITAKDQGTLILFDQAGIAPIPPPAAWSKMYWDPLKKYLAT